MQKIVSGLLYDTELAERICTFFPFLQEPTFCISYDYPTLDRTSSGRYFKSCTRLDYDGPWVENIDWNNWVVRCGVLPVSEDDAMAFLDKVRELRPEMVHTGILGRQFCERLLPSDAGRHVESWDSTTLCPTRPRRLSRPVRGAKPRRSRIAQA